MELILDTIHVTAPIPMIRGRSCRFRLRLYLPAEGRGPAVALATILLGETNPAPALVSYIEYAMTDVWKEVAKPRLPAGARPDRDFVWVHQMPAHGIVVDEELGTRIWQERLTRVTLVWDGDTAPNQQPQWESDIDRAIIEGIIGKPIAFAPASD